MEPVGQTEVEFYFEDNNLIILFGEDRSASIELNNEDEVEVLRTLLADPNLWAQFFGALSYSLKEHI